MREQVAVLVNRAPLDRDVRPERCQRRLEPGRAVDDDESGVPSGRSEPERTTRRFYREQDRLHFGLPKSGSAVGGRCGESILPGSGGSGPSVSSRRAQGAPAGLIEGDPK